MEDIIEKSYIHNIFITLLQQIISDKLLWVINEKKKINDRLYNENL